MTGLHARLLAACYSALIITASGLISLVGCDSDDTMDDGPQSAAGSAAPDPKPSNRDDDDAPAKPGESGGKDQQPSAAGGSKDKPAVNPAEDYPDLRGTCDLSTDFASDEACISKPSAEEGLQVHVGPTNYDDEAEVAKFIMEPGGESSECWTFQMPNEEEVIYQTSVLSGRAGTHHIINQMYEAGSIENGGFTRCGGGTAIGSINGASKAYMARGHVAPEYADVGRKIPARATIQSDMHYFNFTEKPILREYWMNIYYVDPAAIKREALAIRGYGGLGWNQEPIAPGTDMVYKYSCPITGNGHILALLGHYHSHGKRFTASIERKDGSGMEKVFEMYDYLDPAVFEYNTVVENPAFSTSNAGAVTGRLAVFDGDIIHWECHIVNDHDVPLRYVNEVKTGEMCNLWGSSVDIDRISCNLR